MITQICGKKCNKCQTKIQKNKFFIKKRFEFNKDKETSKFLFLNRTCYNGLIRYNKSGKYNSPYHLGRPGIEPAKLLEIINSVSSILSKNNVTFKRCDYSESVSNAKSGDFAFFDPPYFETKAIYSGGLDFNSLCTTIKSIKCNFIMSYNGTRNAKHIIELPTELYDRKVLLKESMSGFSKLKGKLDVVREYAYIKGKYESSEAPATTNIWD